MRKASSDARKQIKPLLSNSNSIAKSDKSETNRFDPGFIC